MVNSNRAAGGEFWGHLLKPDKTPTDLCRNLLQGLANYIVSSLIKPSAYRDPNPRGRSVRY